MRGAPWRLAAAATLFLTGALASGGCSLLGLGIGAAADHNKPDARPVPVPGVCRIDPGQRVILILKDGTTLEGKLTDCDALASTVTVATGQDARKVPLAQVEAVQVPVGKHGKLTGFLVGAAIDIGIAIAWSASGDFGLGPSAFSP